MYDDKWEDKENQRTTDTYNTENNQSSQGDQSVSQPGAENRSYSQNTQESQSYSQPVTENRSYNQTSQEGQNYSQPATENRSYSQNTQGSQTYSQPVTENRSYNQTSQGGQSYGQTSQGGQTYSQPGAENRSYNQTSQGGQSYSQTSQGSQNGTPFGQSDPNYGQQRPGYGQSMHKDDQYQDLRMKPYPYSTTANGQQSEQTHKPHKKNSFMRSAALVTAAAVVFGAVAGGTMFGVNRGAELLFPSQTEASAQTQGALAQTPTVQAASQTSSQNNGTVIEDVSPIVDAVMPSVVAITNTMVYKGNSWFGQSQTYEVPSSGSGIIVGENESELLVVTNNHVIEDATSLSVTFIDQSTVDAAIKGTDSESDLAVIAIPLDKISADTKAQIKAASLGDSDALKMGQGVIAIGNALGLGQSVTVGHVSALNREITVDNVKKNVIQTDAAINPGNSGGALLNAQGEVIGINEAKYASAQVEGVGYAIPISNVKSIIDDLKTRTTKVEVAEAEQGYLGIQIQNIDSSMAQLYGMPEGVYVYKITEDSAASESDLHEKDIITKLDGETVRTNADLSNLLTYYKAGTTVTLTVQSLQDGAYVERQVQVTLKNRPQEVEKQ